MRSLRLLPTLATLALAGLTTAFAGCGDDPASPPEPPQTMVIRAEVSNIHALKSCENDGFSGAADLYSKLRVTMGDVNTGSDLAVVKETSWKLVQLERNEQASYPGIEIEMEIQPYDGMRVGVSLETYENDADGRQITEWYAHAWRYMGNVDCWTDKIEGDCIPESDPGKPGFRIDQTVRMPQRTLPDNGQSPCDVKYEWNISIRPKGSTS